MVKNTHSNASSEGHPRDMSPLDLELDRHNPRLTGAEEGSSPEELLRIMIERFKIEELAESILAAGFIPFDPLVGWEHNHTVTILEGNRRVAALKLLLRPELAPQRYRERWRQLRGRVTPERRGSIESVRITVFQDRTQVDLTAYIGFRHVSGVLQWPALEKAKFIGHLIEVNRWSYSQVAERLGSYAKHVERHYVAYRLAQQAREHGWDGAERMENAFGVLMRALQAPGIVRFLGLGYPGRPEESREPVAESNIEHCKEFVEWTFGTQEKQPILRDSRQLTKWGEILQSPEALRYLRKSPSPPIFERAWFKSGGQAESVADSLLHAADLLQEVVPLVSEHKEVSEVETGVKECTRFLSQILVHFPKIAESYGLRPPDV